MAKILSKSGDSLADVYDVEGSIAGIDQLQSKDVNLVHELGSTLFSERVSGRVVVLDTTAIAQTITFNINFSFTTGGRLLAFQLVASAASRISRAQLSITSGPAEDDQDIPIFFWEFATDVSRQITILMDGSVTVLSALIPAAPILSPNLLLGSDQPRPINTISLRGLTTTFGAGTVQLRAIVYVAFPQVAGLSSRGLPIPSW